MAGDLIALTDRTTAELLGLLDRADQLRQAFAQRRVVATLAGRSFALIWAAAGFRNPVAFELGITRLGGAWSQVSIAGDLDAREPIEDVARYLDNWVDGIVVRARRHEHVVRLAAAARRPVINARTDHNHPCEILGDLAFVRRRRGALDGLKVAFFGEATNLCHSWMEGAARLPIQVVQVCPPGYQADPALVAQLAGEAVGSLAVTSDVDAGLRGADVVCTDCWPARATEDDRARIEAAFAPYRITAERLARAGDDVLFLPCPPVHRGEEVSADAMEAASCAVYAAKDDLMYVQCALLETLVDA